MIKQYIVFILLLTLSAITMAQESYSVVAEAEINGANLTPEAGYQKAREKAAAEAIRMVAGEQISEETFRERSEIMKGDQSELTDIFSRISRSTTTGRIIDRTILEQDIRNRDGIPHYYIRMEAEVIKDEGEPDPDFTAEIVLDRDVFYDRTGGDSDALTFTLWASKNAYLYLFNIMSNDSVQLVLPNSYIRDNYYDTSRDEQGFERAMKKLGMKFPVGLPAGRTEAKESLMLIALKDKKDFTSDNFTSVAEGVIPTYRAAVQDIQRWLIEIPVDRRTETLETFTIKKR